MRLRQIMINGEPVYDAEDIESLELLHRLTGKVQPPTSDWRKIADHVDEVVIIQNKMESDDEDHMG